MSQKMNGNHIPTMDGFLQNANHPFIAKIMEFPLPTKFKVPIMEAYDGMKDPLNHLESYHTHMVFQGVSNEIMCKVFPTILKGVARRWFSMLQPGSVGSFAELCQRFMSQLIGGRIKRIPATYLLTLKEKEGETLKEYMACFNKEIF